MLIAIRWWSLIEEMDLSVKRKSSNNKQASINLALQGGGAHGAFTWGVLDWFLEHRSFAMDSVSGASAGSMNAIALAHGWSQGDSKSNNIDRADQARAALEKFWLSVSESGSIKPPLWVSELSKQWIDGNPVLKFWSEIGQKLSSSVTNNAVSKNLSTFWFENLTRNFSPYQLNPTNYHPLRTILDTQIDFEKIQKTCPFNLFIAATRVRDGKLKVFRGHELSTDVILASACLPTLFQAVKVEDEFYWDGGYTADPAIWPFFYESQSDDTLLVMVNPLHRESVPKTSEDIIDRLNEISFNASLQGELRAVSFVQRMHEQGWLKPEFAKQLRNPRLHALLADAALGDLPANTKMNTDKSFLLDLKNRGRDYAEQWWSKNGSAIGVRSSFDARSLL
jgi:NTE family protein